MSSQDKWSNKLTCPNCDKKGWCLVCPEGTGTLCNRPGGSWGHLAKETDEGAELRWKDPKGVPEGKATGKSQKAALPLATSGEIDRVYRRLLEMLPVPAAVTEELAEQRGLTPDRLAEFAFGYLPGHWRLRRNALDALEREFGRTLLLKVPGFIFKDGKALDFSLSGSGLLIPHRDTAGNVLALQVRLDRAPKNGVRYRWLSGNGGPSVPAVPYLAGVSANSGRVILTEGAFKAIAGADRFGIMAIGLPGASMVSQAVPVLKEVGGRAVAIGYDADHAELKLDSKENHVFGWLRSAVRNLRAEGFTVSLLRWHRGRFTEGTPKGLDDAILAGAELEELEGDQVDQHLQEVAALIGMSKETAPPPPAPPSKLEDILASLATLEPEYRGAELQAALRDVTAKAKGLDAIDRACLQSDLQRHLKRIKAPGAAELAKQTLAHRPAPSSQDGALTPTVPCEDEVAGAAILDRVEGYLRRYIGLPEGAGTALALWVAHTYLIPRLTFSPRLAIQSPVKGCGKTTLMTLLAFLAEKPSQSAWPSTAALFREVEAFAPTLLLDEFDTWINDNEEIRGVINSGFFRPFAYVTRCEGDEHKVKRFNTFCAMALAGINKLPATIQDRSIVISLRKKTAADQVERVQMAEAHSFAAALKPCLARWAADIGEELEQTASAAEVPSELEDRPADLWRPLLAIANLAGGSWPAKARTAAIRLSGRQGDDEDPGIMLLQDVREAFEARGVDAIRSESLLEDLHRMGERPWREFTKGKPLSPNRLAAALRAFGVHSGKIRLGERTFQGYKRADFADAFQRYLFPPTPDQSGTVEQGGQEPRNQATEARSTSCSGSTSEVEHAGTHNRNGRNLASLVPPAREVLFSDLLDPDGQAAELQAEEMEARRAAGDLL